MPRPTAVLLLFLALGCRQPSSPPVTQSFHFVFVSEGCFGACPVYTLKVGARGVATLHAEKYLDRQGDFRATISPAEIRRLLRQHKVLTSPIELPVADARVASVELYESGKLVSLRGLAMEPPVPGPEPIPMAAFTDAMDALIQRTTWVPLKGG